MIIKDLKNRNTLLYKGLHKTNYDPNIPIFRASFSFSDLQNVVDYSHSRDCCNISLKKTYTKFIYNYTGVPQRSHLSPLLFYYLNEFPDRIVVSKCLLYANYFKIFVSSKFLAECSSLQCNIILIMFIIGMTSII